MFNAVIERALDLSPRMFTEGVVNKRTGERMYMVTLSGVVDWAWTHRAGTLNRSYLNMPKAGEPDQSDPCHLCRAGQENVAGECTSVADHNAPAAAFPILPTPR